VQKRDLDETVPLAKAVRGVAQCRRPTLGVSASVFCANRTFGRTHKSERGQQQTSLAQILKYKLAQSIDQQR